MAQTPGDDNKEPTLELPSLKLPGLGRRKRRAADENGASGPERGTADAAAVAQPSVPTGPSEPAASTGPSGPPPGPAKAPRRAPRRAPSLPGFPGRVAAAVVGLLVGLAGAVATTAAIAACEVVRGVSTCGGPPGFFLLVAIVVLMVLLGALLLSALRVADAGSTSFLAVGVVTVVVMLLLLDVVFSPWMFLVMPLLGAASYVLAHWVTTRFAGEDTGRRDWT